MKLVLEKLESGNGRIRLVCWSNWFMGTRYLDLVRTNRFWDITSEFYTSRCIGTIEQCREVLAGHTVKEIVDELTI